MKHNQIDGFRVAWFIPIEMIMSWTLLTLVLNGHPGLAVSAFVLGFAPFFYLLNKYLPQPVYKYSTLPCPNMSNYNMEDPVGAAKYQQAWDAWIEELNKTWSVNGAEIDHYERKPLPKPFERILMTNKVIKLPRLRLHFGTKKRQSPPLLISNSVSRN